MGAGIHGGSGKTYGAAVPGDAVYKSKPELYFDYIGKRTDRDRNGIFDVVASRKIGSQNKPDLNDIGRFKKFYPGGKKK